MASGRVLASCIFVPILLAGFISWHRSETADWDNIFSDTSSSPALELLQRGAKVVHMAKDKSTGATKIDKDMAATTKTTTASALGVGANGVGNLPTFITGLVTDFCVIVLCIIIFVYGSRAYPILYGTGNMTATKGGNEPAQVNEDIVQTFSSHIVKNEDGFYEPANKTWLGFASVSWSLTLDQIEEAAGLDKAMLLHFIELCIRALKWITIPMIIITGPLNCFFGGNAAGQDHESWLSLGNVQFYSWLYWVTGFACIYVGYIMCHMVCEQGMEDFQDVRSRWLLNMDDRRARTLMMVGVPPECQNEEKCKKFWNDITFNNVEKVYLCKDVDARFFGTDPDFKDLAASPNVTEGHFNTLRSMVAQREAVSLALDGMKFEKKTHEDKKEEVPQKVTDAIEKDTNDLDQLNKDIPLMRQWINKLAKISTGPNYNEGDGIPDDLKGKPMDYQINLDTGFITFKDRIITESALKMNLGTTVHDWVMDKAPEPVDIIWGDFTEDQTASAGRSLTGYLLTLGVMIIYMPCVVGLANIAESINLGPLQGIWSSEAPSIGLTIMVDFLPTILVLIFSNCFATYDKSYQQYKLTVWYYWMNILFVVLVTALGTSFMSFVKTLANDPLKIFHLFATTMPNCTHYYMNYLGMQWYSMAMQLTRYMNLIKFRVFKRHHEEEEARNLSEPEDQDYYGIGSRTARFCTLVTIAIVYGTLSPPCGLLGLLTVLWIRTLFGYIFVFNEVRKPDLGGAFYQRALYNMYICLHIYYILMCGVLYIRGNDCVPAILAAIGWVYVFKSQKKFHEYKWEYIELDKISDPTKPRTLHGKYEQPEMYDDEMMNQGKSVDTSAQLDAAGNKITGQAGALADKINIPKTGGIFGR